MAEALEMLLQLEMVEMSLFLLLLFELLEPAFVVVVVAVAVGLLVLNLQRQQKQAVVGYSDRNRQTHRNSADVPCLTKSGV